MPTLRYLLTAVVKTAVGLRAGTFMESAWIVTKLLWPIRKTEYYRRSKLIET